MDDDLDDNDRIIEQDEADFDENALGIGDETTFRRPTEPVTLVLDSRGRSAILNLESKKKELLFIKQKLDSELGKCYNAHNPNFLTLWFFSTGPNCTQGKIIDWVFHDKSSIWTSFLHKRMKQGLLDNHKLPLDDAGSEMPAFFELAIKVHYHDVSPTVLTDIHQMHNFGKPPLLTFTRFEEMVKALSSGAPQNEHGWVPPPEKLKLWRKSLLNLGQQLQEVAYCKGSTIVSVDDDKLRHHSKEAKDLDVKMGFVRGGKKSPTMICVVSKLTDIFLAGHLVQGEEKNIDVAKLVLAFSVGADSFAEADLRRLSVSAGIFCFVFVSSQASPNYDISKYLKTEAFTIWNLPNHCLRKEHTCLALSCRERTIGRTLSRSSQPEEQARRATVENISTRLTMGCTVGVLAGQSGKILTRIWVVLRLLIFLPIDKTTAKSSTSPPRTQRLPRTSLCSQSLQDPGNMLF